LDFASYGAQLVAPSLILGASAGAVATGRPAMVAALVATYLAAGGALAWAGLRWETDPSGRPPRALPRLGRSLRGALFSAVWLAAIPGALWRTGVRRGRVRYDKMPHVGSGPDAAFGILP
jgi:hypothetical protein